MANYTLLESEKMNQPKSENHNLIFNYFNEFIINLKICFSINQVWILTEKKK